MPTSPSRSRPRSREPFLLIWCSLALTTLLTSAAIATATASEPRLAPPLRDLLRRSSLVVVGDIGAVTDHDDGRLLKGHLRVASVLSGGAEPSAVELIEDRKFPSVRPTLKSGQRALVFAMEAPSTTQLRRALPEGAYYRTLEERWGLIVLPSHAAERAVIDSVRGWQDVVSKMDAGDPFEAPLRLLVFSEIGSVFDRLVEDGVANLPSVTNLRTTLTASERETLEAALERTDLPERIRIALVDAIASAGLRSLAASLRDLPGAGPALVRASVAARARLGTARASQEIVEEFAAEDASERLRAVHEMMESRPDGAVEELAELAVADPDREVRLAAIEALGKAKSPAGLQALGQTFTERDTEIRRASMWSITQIGGKDAVKLMGGLVFTAPTDAQRQALVVLLGLGVERDDPVLVRVRETHPDPRVREVAERGLEGHHH